jgi:hypothetical protein
MARWVLVLALLLLTSASFAEQPEWMKQQPIIDRFVWDSASPFYHASIDAIRKYKKLRSEKVAPFVDPRVPEGKTATQHVFDFDGVTVAGFQIKDGEFFVEHVDVRDANYKFPSGLGIGSSSSDLIRHFGKPQKKTRNTLEYQGETEGVVFHLREGRIRRVELLIYVD